MDSNEPTTLMKTRSNAHPRRSLIDLWRTVLLVAGAFCFALLAIGRVPPRDTHEAILTKLRAIDIDHASLQRDVLQARAGILEDFESLDRSIANLHSSVSELRRLFNQTGAENVVFLDHELSNLDASIAEDAGFVEKFKFGNSALQNSLIRSDELLSALHASENPAIQNAIRMPAELDNLRMRFAAEPEQRFAQLLTAHLASMRVSGAADDSSVAAYIFYAERVVRLLPEVDDAIHAIQNSATPTEAQTIQKQYLDAFALVSTRSTWSRILLGSVAGALCLYIAVLVYRLRTQTYRLKQQLDFGSLVEEMNRRFGQDESSPEASVDFALQRYAAFFDSAQFAFVMLDSESGSVKDTYGNMDGATRDAVVNRFLSDVQTASSDERLLHDRYVYHNLRQRGIQALPEGALSAGTMAGAAIDSRTLGILLLRHSQVRMKPSHDEVRLLGQAVVTLCQALRGFQERTAKEILEARLEHSERLEALGTLAGGIAHEFNNALGAILGYGEMALQLRGTSVRGRHYVSEILASGQRAKHIIDQILTFSRKRERISKPFDIREAIDEIVPLVRLSIAGTIDVSTQMPEQAPAVFGNPIEIQQVIMNLCKNAADALMDRGSIVVSLAPFNSTRTKCLSHGELPPGNYVLVSVTDNGSGIQSSVLPHIFEPFFTTKSSSGGTGLGLAAVHGHVTGMNGKIDVVSSPKAGTRFSLYFPVIDADPVPLSQFFNERTIPLGSGELVLIAQKDTNLRLMYEEKIAALGYEPVGLPTIDDVHEWLLHREKLPDLILLDVDLWDTPPNWREVAKTFSAVNTLLMTDPERDGLNQRSVPDIPLLRKPVSSAGLATALFNGIGVCHLPGQTAEAGFPVARGNLSDLR